MPDGPTSTETIIQPKPLVPKVPFTDEVFIVPTFVDNDTAKTRVVDMGYEVTGTYTGEYPVVVNFMKRFLNGPFVPDELDSHETQRRPFRNKQSKKTAQFLKNNRLGLNNLTGVAGIFETLLYTKNRGDEIDLLIDPDIEKRAKNLISQADKYKNRVKSVKITYKIVDGHEELISTEDVSDQEARQFEEERIAEEEKNNKLLEQGTINAIPQKEIWSEVHMVDDPNYNYDKVPFSTKQRLTDEATSIAITFLQQNGFTVKKRSFESPNTV